MRSFTFLLMILLVAAFFASGLTAEPIVIDGEVPADGGFLRVTLLQGLEHPWSMAWLPNGDLLVTERPGRLRLVKGGRLVAAPIDGVPEVFAAGQGGLLDVSLHPRFSENRLIYFSYAHGSAKTNHTRVAVAEFDGDRLDNWTVIFQVGVHKSGTQHFGSRLLWLPDESLLVSIGDGGNPPVRLAGDWIRKQAQNKQNHLGKILRLDDTGDAPQGNPFATGWMPRKRYGATAIVTSRGWLTIHFEKWCGHLNMGPWAEMNTTTVGSKGLLETRPTPGLFLQAEDQVVGVLL
jgi:glucose/arabinose dehydrogenase